MLLLETGSLCMLQFSQQYRRCEVLCNETVYFTALNVNSLGQGTPCVAGRLVMM